MSPRRPHIVLLFLKHFHHGWRVIWGVLLLQLLILVVAATVLSFVEPLALGESLYLTFVTALTIGYGDLAPTTPLGRILCVLIGIVGLIYTGLIIGIATYAVGKAARSSEDEG